MVDISGVLVTESSQKWTVVISKKAQKQIEKLPKKVSEIVPFLTRDAEENGPYLKDWHNYGPMKSAKDLKENSFHCHLKKGNPTYVAIWTADKKEKKIEVYYVGTHEKAPY